MAADDLDLWEYVQSLMRARGWRQGDVVKATGLERSLFTRLRTGRGLTHNAIQGLARGFGVPEAEFLRRLGYSDEGLGATVYDAPRPLGREEIVRLAGEELEDDELLSLVKQRMQGRPRPPASSGDLEDYEPLASREYSPKRETGRTRARPRLVTDDDEAITPGRTTAGPAQPR